MSHNGSGFDDLFICRALIEEGITPRILTRGNKILVLTIPILNIRFLDSMLYCQSSLSKFASRYGLKELKGFVPHQMSGIQSLTLTSIGLPPFKYYSPCYDKIEARKQKKAWYDKIPADYHWNYQIELTVIHYL